MLFVDTSAWWAIHDRSQPSHRAVVAAVREAKRARTSLVTSDYVVDETLTLVRAKAGHAPAVAVGDAIWRRGGAEVFLVDEAVRDSAWAIFTKYADHNLSFTDCTSAALMRQRGIETALTLDSDFAVLGFDVRPRP